MVVELGLEPQSQGFRCDLSSPWWREDKTLCCSSPGCKVTSKWIIWPLLRTTLGVSGQPILSSGFRALYQGNGMEVASFSPGSPFHSCCRHWPSVHCSRTQLRQKWFPAGAGLEGGSDHFRGGLESVLMLTSLHPLRFSKAPPAPDLMGAQVANQFLYKELLFFIEELLLSKDPWLFFLVYPNRRIETF